jgi:hypothetical protein
MEPPQVANSVTRAALLTNPIITQIVVPAPFTAFGIQLSISLATNPLHCYLRTCHLLEGGATCVRCFDCPTNPVPSSTVVGVVGGINSSVFPQVAELGVGTTLSNCRIIDFADPKLTLWVLGTQIGALSIKPLHVLCTDTNLLNLRSTPVLELWFGLRHLVATSLLPSSSTECVVPSIAWVLPQPTCHWPESTIGVPRNFPNPE